MRFLIAAPFLILVFFGSVHAQSKDDQDPAPVPKFVSLHDGSPEIYEYQDHLCGDYDGTCCVDYRFLFPLLSPHGSWGSVEYLLWWTQKKSLPPLVTTSPNGTVRADAGVLGLSTTTILLGGESSNEDARSGGRITVGYWLDDYENLGIGGRFFSLEESSDVFSVSSATGDPILARPFFNAFSSLQDALLIAFPSVSNGNINVRSSSDILGTEIFVRRFLYECSNCRIDLIAGYQHTRIDESLTVSHFFTNTDSGSALPVGTTIDAFDVFGVDNSFHGGEIGLLRESQHGCWSFSLLTKIAIGNMNQSATVNGSTTTTVPAGSPVVSTGGLLTQDSNLGTYEQNEITVVPEIGVNLGYAITPCVDFTVGYSLIYWSNVARAGDLVDQSVNLTQRDGGPLMGEARPLFAFNDSAFWVQGLNFSLQWRY